MQQQQQQQQQQRPHIAEQGRLLPQSTMVHVSEFWVNRAHNAQQTSKSADSTHQSVPEGGQPNNTDKKESRVVPEKTRFTLPAIGKVLPAELHALQPTYNLGQSRPDGLPMMRRLDELEVLLEKIIDHGSHRDSNILDVHKRAVQAQDQRLMDYATEWAHKWLLVREIIHKHQPKSRMVQAVYVTPKENFRRTLLWYEADLIEGWPLIPTDTQDMLLLNKQWKDKAPDATILSAVVASLVQSAIAAALSSSVP